MQEGGATYAHLLERLCFDFFPFSQAVRCILTIYIYIWAVYYYYYYYLPCCKKEFNFYIKKL